jgi:hypothetical protein
MEKKMKKTMLCISAIMLLLLFACSNNDNSTGPGNNEGPGNFPAGNSLCEDGLCLEFDYFMGFYHEDNAVWFEIFSKYNVGNCVVKLNGEEFGIVWEYEDECGWWGEPMNNDFIENLTIGSNISYFFQNNGKTFSGNITIPQGADVTFPEFNINEDFIFNWTLQENTDIQIVEIGIENNDDCFVSYWQLDGDIRTHTISKSYYQDWNSFQLDIYLNCINYKNFGDFFIYAHSGDSNDSFIYSDK